MRKSFNKNQQPLPVIPPPDEPEPIPEPPATNDEMFGKVALEVKAKRGVGKRGKDKQKRVKKPPTEKQLAHLKRIRGLAAEKRKANKKKKDVIREKAKAELKELKENNYIVKKDLQVEGAVADEEDEGTSDCGEDDCDFCETTAEMTGQTRTPMVKEEVRKRKVKFAEPKKVVHPYGKKDYPQQNFSTEQFFNLMDKYQEHREKKYPKKKVASPKQPHPNKKVSHHLRPTPPPIPPNPYAVCFGYNNKW